MFKALEKTGYARYLQEHPFYHDLGLNIDEYLSQNRLRGDFKKKIQKDIWSSVDPANVKPFQPELDDLIRLHFLITSRKVTSILEFGVGHSTLVFNNALRENSKLHDHFVRSSLRRANPFICTSIDDSWEWIDSVRKRGGLEHVSFWHSKVEMATFNDRICTLYESLPNTVPDFIYLDAPSQFSATGDIRGVHTRFSDRVPMSADILTFEHFLLPGTLIVVDGRTANARFLRTNLQRNWKYTYFPAFDQHFFELIESPLGPLNSEYLNFTKS